MNAAGTARDEHAAFLKSMTQVDWLALLVVALYLAAGMTVPPQPLATAAVMLAFGGFAAALRWKGFPLRSTRGRIALDVAVTILFILFMALQTGGQASPLSNLFLLPIVLAAVTLGQRGTLVVFCAVAAAFLALVGLSGGFTDPLPALAARIFGQLGPFALVAYLTQRLTASIIVARRRIAELAERDGLTGLVNQQFFRETLQREHEARAGRGAYSLLMLDMDRLKHVNDTWGHEAGNAALQHVAEAIRRVARASDVACRYGGDEFAVFLPEVTPQTAEVVAQRVRNSVYKSLFHPGGRAQRLTVSVGVGSYPRDGRTAGEVLAAADARMYRDKKLRRQPGDEEPPAPSRL